MTCAHGCASNALYAPPRAKVLQGTVIRPVPRDIPLLHQLTECTDSELDTIRVVVIERKWDRFVLMVQVLRFR